MQQKRAPPTIPCQFRVVSKIAIKIAGINLETLENICTKFGDNPPSGSVSVAPGKSTRQNMSAQRYHFLLGCTLVNMPFTAEDKIDYRVPGRELPRILATRHVAPKFVWSESPRLRDMGRSWTAHVGPASPGIRGFGGVQAGHCWRVGGLSSGADRKGYQKLPNPIANDY